jgi:hypothetical protein
MNLQEVAADQIETTKHVYRISPQRMFSEYNGETENVKNYNGRQLLEMLQNADDAASEASGGKKVLIRLLGNKLIIANTGYPFSQQGLNSIFHSHLSPKQAMEDQIGKKGLGFRSILSWSSKVTIKSHNLCIAFSPDFSAKILQELLLDKKFKIQFNDLNIKKIESPISTLVCPEITTRPDLEQISGYDTIIEMNLHKKAIEEVKNQVKHDIDGEVLLFLNHLEEIEINLNGEITTYQKHLDSPNQINITTSTNEGETVKGWRVNTLTGIFEDLNRLYQLSVAWTPGFDTQKDVMYSYFRTKVSINCKGILHGSFELNADRNLLIDDEDKYNKKLLELVPELFAQTACLIANETTNANYDPLRFMKINLNDVSNLVNVEAIEKLIWEKTKEQPVFPTIERKFINWNPEDVPVYFKNQLLAEYLTPKQFPDVLQWCEDEHIEQRILKMKPQTYTVESLIGDMIIKRNEIPTTVYAGIILAIDECVDDNTQLAGKSLFYDRNKKPLSFDNSIFLPGAETEFDFPPEIGIQIMDKDLAIALLEVYGESDYSGLSESLSNFHVKEYKFSELVEILITYYQVNPTVENTKQLHKNLYRLYESYENHGENWTGNCPIITKKKTVKNANRCYFGREYGNILTEEIYHYDKSKIVAGRKVYDAEDIPQDRWKIYMHWLKVAPLPRMGRMVNPKEYKEYADYAMKKYDFRNKIENDYFKGHAAYREEFSAYGSISVITIDDIDNILNKNTSETILRMINANPALLKNLEDNSEPEHSKIEIWLRYARITRDVKGSKMKSYLKWKFQNTPWLISESGVKAAPSKSATAAYVTAEFRGLIEKPLLNYEELRKDGLNRDKIDFLLTVVGVHRTVNTFPAELLYSILLKLPEIDPAGSKSRTIYNQLAANYDEKVLDQLDTSDRNHREFHRSGTVFCKNGLFMPVNDTYYVNDKRYGATITKQFATIDIERRRGKDKISKLFAVKPLEKIELTIVGLPGQHPLNSLFVSEMENFKPYVYVFRKEVDGGSEKNLIKETKFNLVTSLNLQMTKDVVSQVVSIDEYEYFYSKAKNTVFINVSDHYNDITDLKDDIQVCSIIAEAFSAILDVDSQRQQIRELFSKSGNARDELLRSELDDTNLQRLNDARDILGIISNPKLEFWNSYVKCFKRKKFKLKDDSDENILIQLTAAFPKNATNISAAFNEVNYDQINDESTSELIIDLFSSSQITIADFNNFFYPPIDISKLYELEFKSKIEENKEKFDNLYYDICKTQYNLKLSFLDKLAQYASITPKVENEITFRQAIERDFAQNLKAIFGVDLNANATERDLNKIHTDNVASFWSTTNHKDDKKSLFSQFLGESPTIQSLLYFEDEIKTIATKFDSWLGTHQQLPGSSAPKGSKKLTFGKQALFFDDFSDLKSKIDNILGEDGLKKLKLTTIKTSSTNLVKKGKSGSGGPGARKPKVQKEEIGFLGEYLVYHHLLNMAEDKASVKWVSEYAKLCGINLHGRDGWGYDIEYIPKGAKYPRYVEVKVVGWEDAFHISPNEIQFGEKNKDRHEIFLVRNIDNPQTADIERISGIFDYKGKSFTNNDSFSVINDNYIIKFQKK